MKHYENKKTNTAKDNTILVGKSKLTLTEQVLIITGKKIILKDRGNASVDVFRGDE